MANKLKFELGGTGKSWKYQEISFPARVLRSLNLVDFYACCFFYATNATYDCNSTLQLQTNNLDVGRVHTRYVSRP